MLGKYFKINIMPVLFSLIFLLIGIIFGVFINEEKNGVYFSFRYLSGENFFVLGKTYPELSGLDLRHLNDSEVALLASKINKLSVTSRLGRSLRKIVQSGEGPFAPIGVQVKINLVTEEGVRGPIARACQNSPIFKNPLIAYKATDKHGNNLLIKGILGLNIAVQHILDCDQKKGENYEIWASKDYVEKWIESENFSDSLISANAKMVVANIAF